MNGHYIQYVVLIVNNLNNQSACRLIISFVHQFDSSTG